MKKWKTSSELKAMAKDALLGNYGIAAGSFAILYGIIIGVVVLVYTAITASLLTNGIMNDPASMMNMVESPWYLIITYVITAVLGSLMSTLIVGYSNLALKISRGEKPRIADLFFCYSNHPDKVIILYFIIFAVSLVLFLPAQLLSFLVGTGTGAAFIAWAVLYLIGAVLSVIFSMMISQVYFLYIDYPQETPVNFIKQSIAVMKGNKGRLFYVMLSMLGWYVLILISCGIAAFWVTPYQTVTLANFYRDLKGEFDGHHTETEE